MWVEIPAHFALVLHKLYEQSVLTPNKSAHYVFSLFKTVA